MWSRAASSAACAMPTANAPTLGRKRFSVLMATRKPPSTSPSTSSAGDGYVVEGEGADGVRGEHLQRGRRSVPGRSAGTRNAVTPRGAGALASYGRRRCRSRPRGRWRSSASRRSAASRSVPSGSALRASAAASRARVRLAQREGGDRTPRGHLGEPALPLRGRARLGDGVRCRGPGGRGRSRPRCSRRPGIRAAGTARARRRRTGAPAGRVRRARRGAGG